MLRGINAELPKDQMIQKKPSMTQSSNSSYMFKCNNNMVPIRDQHII